MKSIKYVVSLLIGIMISSCDYLDVVPDQIPTLDNAFSDRYAAEKMLGTCYWALPRSGNWGTNPAMLGSMEIIMNEERRSIAPIRLALGEETPSYTSFDFWSSTEDWNTRSMYAGINDCNTFLENIEKVMDLQRREKDRWIAEVKLIKAYMHFYLLRQYGPIVLLKENTPVGESTQGIRVYRQKVDECFDYIVELMDEVIASNALPENITVLATELGRFTQAVAYAMKAKVLVYRASPLFNGNKDYATFLDHRGEPFFNQTEDPGHWVSAAEACRKAIEICRTTQAQFGLYQITDYKPPKTDLPEEILRVNTLRSAYSERWNKELIWCNSSSKLDHQAEAIPRLERGTIAMANYFSVPFSVVDRFYSSHGVPIEEDREWLESGRYAMRYSGFRTATEEYKYYIRLNEQTADMNFDREPRFYATLGFDRGIWYGNSVNSIPDDASQALYPSARWMEYSSVSGNPNYYNATGYWPKKLVSFEAVFQDANRFFVSATATPEIRYSDLLLLAAEAINETTAGESGTPAPEVYEYINAIRERAGLDGIVESYQAWTDVPDKPLNKSGMREIIHRERKIELACESHYHWDVRRWKTAPQELSHPVQGWSVSAEEVAAYYKEHTVYLQPFSQRMYFAPIPQGDIIKNPNLIQNQGY